MRVALISIAVVLVLAGCSTSLVSDDAARLDASMLDVSAALDGSEARDASSVALDARSQLDAAVTHACELVPQTGCAADEKCTLIDEGGNLRGCVPLRGAVGEGEPCEREALGFGHDDCGPGLTCTFIGVLPPSAGGSRRCRRLCEDDAICGVGQRCALLTTEAPFAGFCGPTCTPFGDDCAAPLECTRAWSGVDADRPFFASCRLPGDVTEGSSCAAVDESCASGLVCAEIVAGGGLCARPCDAAHPCPSGACTEIDPSIGLCLGG